MFLFYKVVKKGRERSRRSVPAGAPESSPEQRPRRRSVQPCYIDIGYGCGPDGASSHGEAGYGSRLCPESARRGRRGSHCLAAPETGGGGRRGSADSRRGSTCSGSGSVGSHGTGRSHRRSHAVRRSHGGAASQSQDRSSSHGAAGSDRRVTNRVVVRLTLKGLRSGAGPPLR